MQPELGTFDSTLGQTLYRLLFDAQTRERFVDGQRVGLSAEDDHALASIDRAELRDAGNRIRRDLLRGSGDLAGGLGHAYQRTLEHIEGAGHPPSAVAAAYLHAPEYERYRELPHAGRGWCAEEAFYRFMVRTAAHWSCNEPEAAAVLRHEFLGALLSVLAVNPNPGFDVADPALVVGPAARWVVECYDERAIAAIRPQWAGRTQILYAATVRGLVCGPVTEQVVQLLRAGSWSTVVEQHAERGTEPSEATAAAARRLAAMGLVEGA